MTGPATLRTSNQSVPVQWRSVKSRLFTAHEADRCSSACFDVCLR